MYVSTIGFNCFLQIKEILANPEAFAAAAAPAADAAPAEEAKVEEKKEEAAGE